MYWTFILLALCGALYRIVTVGDDAAWWAVIAILLVAFLVDLNREYRGWVEARGGRWLPEDDHEHN